MEELLPQLFVNVIAPHLDGRDAARLCRVSRKMKKLVEASRYLSYRRKTHYIQLNCVSELEWHLGHHLEELNSEVDPSFWYWGEGKKRVRDPWGRTLVVNNHYDHVHFCGSNWGTFAEQCTHKFWLLEYPPLQGVGRYKIGKVEFWRGCCAKILIEGGSVCLPLHDKSAKRLHPC